MTLLQRASEILDKRSEEPERNYGDFTESIDRTAQLATLMGKKEITPEDVLNVLIALKLARESHAHKEDNILDAIVYLAQKNSTYDNKLRKDVDSHLNKKSCPQLKVKKRKPFRQFLTTGIARLLKET
jgi:hypothetical protein